MKRVSRAKTAAAAKPPAITYTESDRIVWEEDLESFVPKRIFDAHIHLWDPNHLPAGNPARASFVAAGMRKTEKWNETMFPGRRIDYLVLGTPAVGIDVRRHNMFMAKRCDRTRIRG